MKQSWLAVSAALIVACSPAEPSPKADIKLATKVMRVLSADDMQGRRAGTDGNTKARLYIADQAAKLNGGVAPKAYSFARPVTQRNGDTFEAVGTNLTVTVPGKTPGGPILEITAHFDHLGVQGDAIFNGADDNASGVGALLAILKSFRANPPEHEVRISWLDTEEGGLAGAGDYVDTQLDDRPRVNFNLDMIAQNADGVIYMAGAHHTPALKPLVEQAAETVDIEVRFGHDRPQDGMNNWTMQSDHGAFHSVGIPFVYFGVEDHPYYHQTTDEFATIPVARYHAAVQLAVNMAHVLDDNLDAIAKPRTAPAITEP
ncbi:aminopeptidase [Algimonas arctica]|uniref:Aminopeptidase n=1 Tax=Algimonas arctica TaxID=1479486 RepID=A0A8J3G2M6_9PROT|nr:M20/M25/M40 family metallo-hydrolase [Algimonas arctica]GHA96214.1 aminopeptidase [Algimonas arctica]